ncbi:hypothetical protein [Winogradskyella marincola]|uniref:Uncharacterized protein n=1 Tax=Winogradskyella marincola TaxID=3037795 RepID=A0ABT6FXX2_9FLAO|nr:hypothetical protein [Winogradskyella sp. YYF002]MDG4714635.1 hypothetical protein [Winogradskyella sp. YYF002]
MKYSKMIMALVCVALFLNMQCDDEGMSLPESNCASFAAIDSYTYGNSATSSYTINNVSINEDCLAIEVSATGCDGNTWGMQLVDSDVVSESNPPERFVKFFLINTEDCLAVVDRARSFDLTPLQVEGVNEIIINVDEYSEPITYTY